MAGFALIFARDGSPVSAERLERMARHLAYRGGGVSTWIDGSIGLAQIGCRQSTAPVSVTTSADPGKHLVFDGRLDNRDELARALSAGGVRATGEDDGRLALLALERWGLEAGARHMVGDFAGALWDANARAAWLLRDALGLRPLYLRETARELVCASDLKTLVVDAPSAVNEAVVAECLSGGMVTHRETLYQGIERLPMAHVSRVTSTTRADCQHWSPTLDSGVARRTADDRAAQFLELFGEAVAARVAGQREVALLLSGGLDSSSIAAELATQRQVGWRCYTLGQPRVGDDEIPLARGVADYFGAPHVGVMPRPVEGGAFLADARDSRDLPGMPNGVQGLEVRRRIADSGTAVALNGLGSDEWFGGSFLTYADLARRGSLLQLARTIWSDRGRVEPTLVHLRIAAWALCPPVVQRSVRRALGRSPVPAWIGTAFARRTALADRLRVRDIPVPDFPTLSQRAIFADTTCGDYVYSSEMQERANSRLGLDERYPFHDRRLVEFALALPETDRWAPGASKALVRRAMAGRLPAGVIARTVSPDANPVLLDALRALGGRAFFEHLAIAETGWVNAEAIRSRWNIVEREALAGRYAGREMWALWPVAAVELWHRALGTREEVAPLTHAATGK